MDAGGLSQRRARLVARLRSAKTRAREEAVLVEGVRAVAEALDAGAQVSFAIVSPRLSATGAGSALAEALRGHDVVELEDAELDSLADTERPQGVLLVCREPAGPPDPPRAGGRYLVLDAVQDPGNAGTLVRAAVAFRLDGVFFLEGSVDPWGAKAVRASAGMIFRVPVSRGRPDQILDLVEGAGVPVLVADADGEDVSGFHPERGFALVVGNEGAGVGEAVARRASRRVAVRTPGEAESLNVAMAGTVLLYALTSGSGI